MPDYTVQDTQTGKTVTFQWNGDKPPTDADMAQVFSAARQQPTAQPQASASVPSDESGGVMQTVGDLARGVEKGAVGTFVGLGELVHQIPGVTKAVDALYGTPGISQTAFQQAKQTVEPSNATEAIGKTAEQIGEFFVPVSDAAKLGKLGEVVKATATGAAQSGSPAAGAVSGALTAILPGSGAAAKLSDKLGASAEQDVVRALGPTKEWAKVEANKLAPEMLARGVKGSREAMQARAAEMSQQAGRNLAAAYEAAGKSGQTISGLVIRGELDFAKDALMEVGKDGTRIPVEGMQPAIQKLSRLQDFVEKLGDDIPVDQASRIKTVWDRIVAKSGMYGPKAMQSATDNAEAWATREAAGQFRRLLADVPDVQALNKEYAFWKGLKNVLGETAKRTQAQSGGLYSAIGTASGMASGYASGHDLTDSLEKAFVGAAIGRNVVKLMQSPYWRTAVSAPLKQHLADALATGSAGAATGAASRILAALPPQVKLQLAQ